MRYCFGILFVLFGVLLTVGKVPMFVVEIGINMILTSLLLIVGAIILLVSILGDTGVLLKIEKYLKTPKGQRGL